MPVGDRRQANLSKFNFIILSGRLSTSPEMARENLVAFESQRCQVFDTTAQGMQHAVYSHLDSVSCSQISPIPSRCSMLQFARYLTRQHIPHQYPTLHSTTVRQAHISALGRLKPRSRRLGRALSYTAAGVTTLWLADTELNASAVTRNLRTLWTVSMSDYVALIPVLCYSVYVNCTRLQDEFHPREE